MQIMLVNFQISQENSRNLRGYITLISWIRWIIMKPIWYTSDLISPDNFAFVQWIYTLLILVTLNFQWHIMSASQNIPDLCK